MCLGIFCKTKFSTTVYLRRSAAIQRYPNQMATNWQYLLRWNGVIALVIFTTEDHGVLLGLYRHRTARMLRNTQTKGLDSSREFARCCAMAT